MNTIAMTLAVVLFGLATAPPAFADSGSLLQCENRGFVLNKCTVPERELAPAASDGAHAFEADTLVTYDFPCSGHRTNIGARAGEGAFTPFTQGVLGGTIVVRGAGPLVAFDPDPHVTARLSFRPGCRLDVLSVTTTPSNATIQRWADEAQTEARVLGTARDLYVLSRQFADITRFTIDQLRVVISAAEDRVVVETNPIVRRRWLALRDSLVAMRDGQPLPVPAEDVNTYLDDFASNARTGLLEEAERARTMIRDRFERYQLVVDQLLRDAMASLPAA